MKIWLVISITQLELYVESDLYHWERNMKLPPITDNQNESEYEVERLLGKCTTWGKTKYLVKWVGYENEHNVWYDVNDLKNATWLIRDYEVRPRTSGRRGHSRA